MKVGALSSLLFFVVGILLLSSVRSEDDFGSGSVPFDNDGGSGDDSATTSSPGSDGSGSGDDTGSGDGGGEVSSTTSTTSTSTPFPPMSEPSCYDLVTEPSCVDPMRTEQCLWRSDFRYCVPDTAPTTTSTLGAGIVPNVCRESVPEAVNTGATVDCAYPDGPLGRIVCTWACRTGYAAPMPTPVWTCDASGFWSKTAAEPTCAFVECGAPPPVQQSSTSVLRLNCDSTLYKYDERCYPVCNPGWTPLGMLRCSASGAWTGTYSCLENVCPPKLPVAPDADYEQQASCPEVAQNSYCSTSLGAAGSRLVCKNRAHAVQGGPVEYRCNTQGQWELFGGGGGGTGLRGLSCGPCDASTSYLDYILDICRPYTPCPTGSYDASARDGTSDSQCVPHSVCAVGTYARIKGTGTSDTVCSSWAAPCRPGTYEAVQPSPFKNRQCQTCSCKSGRAYALPNVCDGGFHGRAVHATCGTCTKCSRVQYAVSPCSSSADAVCRNYRACGVVMADPIGAWETTAPKEGADRGCGPAPRDYRTRAENGRVYLRAQIILKNFKASSWEDELTGGASESFLRIISGGLRLFFSRVTEADFLLHILNIEKLTENLEPPVIEYYIDLPASSSGSNSGIDDSSTNDLDSVTRGANMAKDIANFIRLAASGTPDDANGEYDNIFVEATQLQAVDTTGPSTPQSTSGDNTSSATDNTTEIAVGVVLGLFALVLLGAALYYARKSQKTALHPYEVFSGKGGGKGQAGGAAAGGLELSAMPYARTLAPSNGPNFSGSSV